MPPVSPLPSPPCDDEPEPISHEELQRRFDILALDQLLDDPEALEAAVEGDL